MKINTITTLGMLCMALAAGSCCRPGTRNDRDAADSSGRRTAGLRGGTDRPEHRKLHARERGLQNGAMDGQQSASHADDDSRRRGRRVGAAHGHRPVPAHRGGYGAGADGDSQDKLDFVRDVEDDYAIFVPAGKWHNIVNKGDKPLKLYSIYAPAEHPHGTVHKTQQEAMEAEHAH